MLRGRTFYDSESLVLGQGNRPYLNNLGKDNVPVLVLYALSILKKVVFLNALSLR